ncbi:MAG: cache domain-containing protein, partial [Deferrisomatales bacterium]
MARRRTVSGILFFSTVSVVLTMGLVLGAAWVYDAYRRFEREVRQQTEEYTQAQTELIRGEVRKAIGLAALFRSDEARRDRVALRDRVNEAYAVAEALHRRLGAGSGAADVTASFLEALRPLRFGAGSGHFFALGLDGVVRFDAEQPALEGRSLRTLLDDDGAQGAARLLEIARQRGEGFHE